MAFERELGRTGRMALVDVTEASNGPIWFDGNSSGRQDAVRSLSGWAAGLGSGPESAGARQNIHQILMLRTCRQSRQLSAWTENPSLWKSRSLLFNTMQRRRWPRLFHEFLSWKVRAKYEEELSLGRR